jgi:hypothetical protein
MRDWKEIGKKLLFPPIWLILLLTIISTITLVMIFVKGWEMHPVAYICYVVAFYTLTVVCIICWKDLPGYYHRVKDKLHANKYVHRYLTDVEYKIKMLLYGSLGINLIYVAINAISAIVYKTYWFGIFAIYYGIIAIMRFLLVRYVRKNPIGGNYLGELKRARLCAGILLTVNLALSGAVLMMVYLDRGFQYQGILIYVIAMYTFYITTTAIIDMVKYRKYKSPVMSITKVIKMASALFSMLFLETAMFAQFGADTSQEVKRIMIMATGAAISVIVISMVVYMIVKTTKEIKQLLIK